MEAERRRLIRRVLLSLAFVLAVVAGPMLYVGSVVDDSDAFVALADDALTHPEVRRAVAEVAATVTIEVVTTDETITDSLPGNLRTLAVPITQLATAQITEGVFALLDTDVATQARSAALREVHRQLTTEGDEIIIDLRAVLVRMGREIGGPTVGAGVAELVSGSDRGVFTIASSSDSGGTAVDVVRAIPALGVIAGFFALIALVVSIVLAENRSRALTTVGLVIAGAAVTASVIVSVALTAVATSFGGLDGPAVAIAEVLSADFAQHQRGGVINGLVFAVVGLLIGGRPAAVALRSLPGDLWHRRPEALSRVGDVVGDNPPAARAVGWLIGAFVLLSWSSPTVRVVVSIVVVLALHQGLVWSTVSGSALATRLRSSSGIARSKYHSAGSARLRANVAIVTALVFLLWPAWSLRTVVVFVLVGSALQAAVDALPARRLANQQDAEELEAPSAELGRSRLRTTLLAGAAVVAVVLGILVTTASVEKVEAATACNGAVELCERRVDEVVFAGSHNAMSSNALGWKLAMQDGDMVAQLDHGVRALLIDALYWSDDGELDGGSDAVTNSVIDAALGDDQPRSGTWLCHGFCALGATDLTAGLADIKTWLDENPREVLILIVQDEVTFPDLEAAFVASELRGEAFVHETGTPFPTLEEMIDSGQQVLVYGENGGEPGTWFQNGYAETFAETPYTFDVRTDFNCGAERGREANPLFLINHWLTNGLPVREAAAVVNSRDVLLERANECELERGRMPNVFAVDFVETGDLVDVVAELNGVD